MASYQFLADVRRRDPFWYRFVEVCAALAIIASNTFSDAIEDGAARIWRRLHQ